MAILTLAKLKRRLQDGAPPTMKDWEDLVDSLLTHSLGQLADVVDAASVTIDAKGYRQAETTWETDESTPTMNIQNLGKVLDVSVQANASGGAVVTVQGTGYKFIDMDSKASPAASVDLTLSDTHNEVSLKDSGFLDGTDKIVYVKKI